MDADDFEDLYRRLSGPFFSVAAGVVGPISAQDVVHEVFEVVWQKRRRAPAEPTEWAPWSWGILRNKIRHELQRRRRKHHDHRLLDDLTEIGVTVPPEPALRDVADVVISTQAAREVWSSLTTSDRELLLLTASTDLSGAEIAALIGISHDAYRRRVFRMRSRLDKQARTRTEVPARPLATRTTP